MKIKLLTLSLTLVVMSAFAFSPHQAVVQGSPLGAGTAIAATTPIDCGRDTDMSYDRDTGLCVRNEGMFGTHTINGLIVRIINILLAIAAALAILFIVIGGFQYITSAGNEEQAGKGKKTVINAIIGLILVILSYAIVNVIATAVGTAT